MRPLALLAVLALGTALVLLLTASGPGGRAAGEDAATGGGKVVYSNRPADIHGLPVALFESYAIAEFGGEVQLGGTARSKPVVSLLMASYACQHGGARSCRTSPGASFSWPLTLEI